MSLRDLHEKNAAHDLENFGDIIENLGAGASAEHFEPEARDDFRTRGDGQASRSSVALVDLGAVVRSDAPPLTPGIIYRDDGTGTLYPALVHELHAEPGAGKTWFALYACGEAVRTGGSVLFVDYESSPAVFVERLRALEVDDDIIANPERVGYVNPDVGLGVGELAEFHRLGDKRALVVIDAAGPALARQGFDENSNHDVARWHETFVRPFTRGGAAVLVLDHLTKNPETRVRGSRGASAKLQLVDVSYSAKQVRGFSRSSGGVVAITCAKDRNGHFAIGEAVATVHLEPHPGGLTIDVRSPEDHKPTVLMDRVSRFLEGTDSSSQRGVREHVTGKATGLRWALDELVAEGCVSLEDGRYRSVRPYRDES
jgi:AAA domain